MPGTSISSRVFFVAPAFFSSSTTKDTKVHEGKTSWASTGVDARAYMGNLIRGSLSYAHGR
jgi:hypothetical protein